LIFTGLKPGLITLAFVSLLERVRGGKRGEKSGEKPHP
jgi:hypothetical protein